MSYQKGLCRAAYCETICVKGAGLHCGVILLCTLFLAVSNFIFSFMLQKSIDSVLQGRLDVFLLAAGIFLIASVLYGVCFYFCSQHKEKLRQATVQQLKTRLLEHYLRLPVQQAALAKQGEVMTIVTQDADKVAGFVCDIAIPFLQLVVTVLVGAVYVVMYSWQMFLVVMICSIAFYFVNAFLLKRIQASFAQVQAQTDRQKDFWVDWYENAAVIKIFSMNTALNTIYETLFAQKKDAAVRHARNKAESRACSEGSILAIEFLVLLIGVFLVRAAQLTLGALVGVWNASIGTFVYPMMDIPNILAQYAEAGASYQRIRTFADRPEEPGGQECADGDMAKPQILVRGVTFAYDPDSPILSDVSFSLEKGEIIVIQGESGTGKSTLIKLLLQMYLPQRGEIILQDSSSGKQTQVLRPHLAYVPQGNSLLHTTLSENLWMKSSAISQKQQMQMQNLCAELGLKDKIDALPKKFETIVGEDTDFSEGQAQRLAVIRAVLRGCDFLLLDEPFSALDAQNVQAVTQLLNRLRTDKGLIVVTHREAPDLLVTKKLYLERGRLHEEKA